MQSVKHGRTKLWEEVAQLNKVSETADLGGLCNDVRSDQPSTLEERDIGFTSHGCIVGWV
jgi:hypothetical protein